MPRIKDDPPAVRVYTVSDESKYLIVRNVPALGCGDELLKLFGSYGPVEECKPMDAEECEQYTDVYWIKFCQVNNARFAKKKLDEHVFFGNRLQVSYAPQYESLSDTKDKLEGRRREVLARLNPGKFKGSKTQNHTQSCDPLLYGTPSQTNYATPAVSSSQRDPIVSPNNSYSQDSTSNMLVTSDEAYFSSQSMNQTVQLVREKLHKIQSSADHLEAGLSKKPRVDNRRRI
ncbi:RNA-binding protein 48 [Heracleum sosnowskyi]|uniref:RNA-binding protein 48 n=1 Tax=Heracleum sosnowskyi TaxID=360622 RepID=A0AAD8MM47_9APIA|nr:RNA-binding protein 48 [Heracleum sosnowskyi]